MSHDRRVAPLALLVVGLTTLRAGAEQDPLVQAEAAYTRIEFGDAQRFARSALARGGYDRAHLIRIYFILGITSAVDGKDEEAIEAFKRLLTLDPDTKLDRGLSPKMQGP